jgi:hypothetical protein
MKTLKYASLLLLFLNVYSCSEVINKSKDNNATKESIYTGMFTYMADANMFFPCDGSQRMPVAMTGEYLTLERKYTALTKGSGERIYVRVEGSTKEVPAMEGNGKELALVVSKVLEVDNHKDCN